MPDGTWRVHLECFAIELPHVPISCEAHLREGNDLDTGVRGLRDEVPNASKIVGLVARSVLELHCRHTNVAPVDAFLW